MRTVDSSLCCLCPVQQQEAKKFRPKLIKINEQIEHASKKVCRLHRSIGGTPNFFGEGFWIVKWKRTEQEEVMVMLNHVL